MRNSIPALRLLSELVLLGLGVGAAWLLLRWLHGQWMAPAALVAGSLGPIAVRLLVRAAAGRSFPPFLVRWLDGIGLVAGVSVGAWATLVDEPLPYWILRWREAAALSSLVAILGAALVALVYTHGRMAAEVEAREARLGAARELALRARLSALTAQINPHFLFNTLNILAELTHQDPAATERLITDLAWLMRYSLQSSATTSVPLALELEAVRRYLRIEQARLGGRLRVVIDAPAELDAALVPGLCLQPLVENAVKYAAKENAGEIVVSVEVELVGGRLRCEVGDNGPGLPEEIRARLEAGAKVEDVRGTGTGGAGGGLWNVQQRLFLLHGEQASLTRVPGGDGTRLRMELPG